MSNVRDTSPKASLTVAAIDRRVATYLSETFGSQPGGSTSDIDKALYLNLCVTSGYDLNVSQNNESKHLEQSIANLTRVIKIDVPLELRELRANITDIQNALDALGSKKKGADETYRGKLSEIVDFYDKLSSSLKEKDEELAKILADRATFFKSAENKMAVNAEIKSLSKKTAAIEAGLDASTRRIPAFLADSEKLNVSATQDAKGAGAKLDTTRAPERRELD